MTHRVESDSSWWPVLRLIAEKNSVSIVLIGSAMYMTAEQWFASAAGGMEASVLEVSYTVPAGVGKTDMDGFGRSLRDAERVISI